MDLYTFSFIVIFCIQQGTLYELTSDTAPLIYESQGGTVTLQCNVEGDDYKLVDELFYWKKYLPTSSGANASSVATVSVIRTIQAPFLNSRYVASRGASNDFSVVLTISDLRIEDSGKYTCEIFGTDGFSKKAKTFHLNVLVPVRNVEIKVYEPDANKSNDTPKAEPVFYTNKPMDFECLAYGGFPKPEVKVYIGARRIGSSYGLPQTRTFTIKGDKKGLQWMDYTVKRSNPRFQLRSTDDGKMLRCEGFVREGVKVTETPLKLIVYGPPSPVTQYCEQDVSAKIGSIDHVIQCYFRSKPTYTGVMWKADKTGQTISPGEGAVDGYTAFVSSVQGVWSANLKIAEVADASFQSYTLTMSNDEGDSTVTITLSKAAGTGGVTDASISCHHVVLLHLVMALLASWLLRSSS